MSKKYFISADIEGTAGACLWECGRSGTDEYQKQCVILKKELLALLGKINEMEPECQIVIKDAHAGGCNFDICDFPENCMIVRGWDEGPLCMMQELDETYDGVFLLGYHSGAGMDTAPMAHTFSSRKYSKITLNGMLLTEFLISYYTSAMFRVPVLMISGDKKICEEAVKHCPTIHTAKVQEGKGGSVITVSEQKAEQMIKKAVEEALKEKEHEIVDLPEYYEMEISYYSHVEANRSSYYPGCMRIGSHTIRYETDSFEELLCALIFL